MFMSKGADAVHATAQAQQMIYNMVQRQATLLSFLENFRLLAFTFLAVIPLMLSDEENRIRPKKTEMVVGTSHCCIRSSFSTLPSRMWMMRWARMAISGSCVTSTMVLPCCYSRSNRPMISLPVALSSAPVGSSASRMDGLFTSARATATRCRWPPESSLGL